MNTPNILLTAEQFSQLATNDGILLLGNKLINLEKNFVTKKDIRGLDDKIVNLEKNSATKEDIRGLDKKIINLEKNSATKDDLKNFATKDDLKNFATKDDLKNFATKDDLKNFATKDDFRRLDEKFDLRFNQLEYMITTSFDHLDDRMDEMDKRWQKHDHSIDGLQMFTADHALRIKKLEFHNLPAK